MSLELHAPEVLRSARRAQRALAHLRRVAASLRQLQLSRGDVSGAFADLGVLVPLEAALITVNGLNPTATLLGIGLIYVASAAYFRIPMPVQPLKAFSAIAIASQVGPEVIAAGALLMSALLALLAVGNLANSLAERVPIGVVRGVQLGLGLLLVRNGLDFVLAKPFLITGERLSVDLLGSTVAWGLPLAVTSGVLLMVLLRWPILPASVAVLMLGIGAGVVLAPAGWAAPLELGPAYWTPGWPRGADFILATTLLVIPQLPLTLANSVVATADAGRAYYGARARLVTPKHLAMSIALGNLWAGLGGGLPNCHGCGGLTAHFRMGARSPAATMLTGVVLAGVGLFFGQAALQVRALVPYSVLGLLLLYVGIEHLKLGWASPNRRHRVTALVSAGAALLADGNLAVGAAAGLAWHVMSARVHGLRTEDSGPRTGETG